MTLDSFNGLCPQRQENAGDCRQDNDAAVARPRGDSGVQENVRVPRQRDHNEPSDPRPADAAKGPAAAGGKPKPNEKRGPLDERKFASAKLNLLLAVGLDAELTRLAARLANILVGKYMNADKGGDAWAGIGTYCGALGMSPKSERHVREALALLVERGHLVAVRAGTTRYSIPDKYFQDGEPRPKTGRSQGATPARNGPESKPATAPNPAQNGPVRPAQNGPINTVQETPEKESDSRAPQLDFDGTGATEETRASSPARRKPKKADEPDPSFEPWWSVYPLHKGELAARKAYAQALADGATVEGLLLGAQRYAAERDREPDPEKRERYTTHAARWLNERRWLDEPPPPRATPYPPPLEGARFHQNDPRGGLSRVERVMLAHAEGRI